MSVDMQGPVRAKVYDTLPTKNGAVFPVLAPAAVSETPCSRNGVLWSAAELQRCSGAMTSVLR